MKIFLLFLILVSEWASGQKLKKSDKAVIDNLKSEISFLSSDKLEGRRMGTPGEKLAYEYLSAQFKKIGLTPKGDNNSFIQAFEINEGKAIMPATHLSINGDSLQIEKDFFPFIFSANGTIEANASPAFQEKGMPWFLDIKETLDENQNNPHFDLEGAIREQSIESANKGASALIVFNSGTVNPELAFDGKSTTTPLKIPVVFITKEAAQKYLSDKSSSLDIKLQVSIAGIKRTGHNVIGYIDKGAAKTIIIGAHYDHLGYGEDHNSLWTGKPEIHNGADDNASGTAAILELSKLLKKSKLKNNNYLFIGFSGEELGLLGSKYFVKHPTIKLEEVNYMINCDMVGRLNEDTKMITVGGYGTSPLWKDFLPAKTKFLNIKFDSSGIGPSDQTSFYLKNIPVLFFFTGVTRDYHKPTDDVDKINFNGELRIIEYIYDVIEKTNKAGRIEFSKTRDPEIHDTRFTVTLGIIPDYTFEGKGLRIDAVLDGETAQKAGMIAGDVITRLNDFEVTEIYSYMAALQKFKKGDAAKVTLLRGKEVKTFDIVF